jgi:hypothetical protein
MRSFDINKVIAILAFLFILAVIGINVFLEIPTPGAKREPTKFHLPDSISTQAEFVPDYSYDILDADSVWINGKVRVYDKLDRVYSLGLNNLERSVDSNFCGSFFYDADALIVEYLRSGSTYFEKHKDSISMGNIELKQGKLWVETPKITLTTETKLEEIKSLFPKSFISRYEIENKDVVVTMLLCPECDEKFYLVFRDGKLRAVEHYFPC